MKEIVITARHYKKQIGHLEKMQDALYKEAAKEMGFDEKDDWAVDYFYNGFQSKEFEARLAKMSA